MSNTNGVCQLLALPAELRNKIYYFALVNSGSIDIVNIVNENKSCEPALLRTCHKVRREALPMFYGCNVFFGKLRIIFIRWFRRIGYGKAAIINHLRGFRIDPARGWLESTRGRNIAESKRVCLEVGADFERKGLKLAKGVFRLSTDSLEDASILRWISSDSGVVLVTRSEAISDVLRTFEVKEGHL